MKRAGDVAALAVLAVSLAIMANKAAGAPDRWPWVWAAMAYAIPFLLLLSPAVQQWGRSLVERTPSSAAALPMLLTAVAVAIAVASGTVPTVRLVLLPVFVAIALLLVLRESGAPGGWRLLAVALALGLVAGIWDRALKVLVPGNQSIGLAFFLAVTLGLFLYRVARPLPSLDVGLAFPVRDWGVAAAGFAAIVAVAIPLGFVTEFVIFNPRLDDAGFALERLLGLIIFVGIPEEMLFRGLIQEGISRLRSARSGWIIASVIFGLSHITKKTGLTALQRQEEIFGLALNWRYALLATIAGLGYGWVYRRTGRISAAAVTHGAVNLVWSGLFGR